MFENLVKEKINSEKKKVIGLFPVSRDIVRKSELSPFVKNFIFNETQEITENDFLDELIEKGVKLMFNYTIRPKWTLLNYVYGSMESKSDNELRHKLKVFTFYKFYPDTIINYIDEETHLYVSKNKVELLLNDTNEVLYNKLTTDISGVKIKNFLLNVFKLKYENEADINLESAIPFSFIKIFLEDKGYDDLLEKFDVISNLKENTLVSYKDIIKVLTDKYTAHETKHEEKPDEKIYEQTENKEEATTDAQSNDEVFEPIIIPEHREEKIEVELPKKEAKEKKPAKKEINYSKYDIYSDDLVKERDAKEKEEKEKELEEETEIFAEAEDNELGDQYQIKRLFNEKELNSLRDKVYGGSKTAMRNSFRELAKAGSWKDASNHIKNLFNEQKVNIYNKQVVKFIDALQEHFNSKEK